MQLRNESLSRLAKGKPYHRNADKQLSVSLKIFQVDPNYDVGIDFCES